MIVNQTNLDAAFVGFKVLFEAGFMRAGPQWDKVAMEVPSSTGTEVYPWLGQTSKFREWVGDRVLQGLATHGFSIVNKHYENTIEISITQFEDDQYGIYKPMFEQMGMDAKLHPDSLVFNLFKNGNASICYDGQNFFDPNHPGKDGNGNAATFSNYMAGASQPWYLIDSSKIVKPFIFQKRKDYVFVPLNKPDDQEVFMRKRFVYGLDARVNAGYGLWQLAFRSELPLTPDNYGAARAAMGALRADNGDPLDIMPDLLVVDPSNEGAANTITKADSINATSNVWKGTATVLKTARIL